jgi:hypothetical protein
MASISPYRIIPSRDGDTLCLLSITSLGTFLCLTLSPTRSANPTDVDVTLCVVGGTLVTSATAATSHFAQLKDIKFAPVLWLVSSAAADIVITVCLFYALVSPVPSDSVVAHKTNTSRRRR